MPGVRDGSKVGQADEHGVFFFAKDDYPLVMTNIDLVEITIFCGKTHELSTGQFSMSQIVSLSEGN